MVRPMVAKDTLPVLVPLHDASQVRADARESFESTLGGVDRNNLTLAGGEIGSRAYLHAVGLIFLFHLLCLSFAVHPAAGTVVTDWRCPRPRTNGLTE